MKETRSGVGSRKREGWWDISGRTAGLRGVHLRPVAAGRLWVSERASEPRTDGQAGRRAGVFSGRHSSQSRLQWRGARRARRCRKSRRDNYKARDKIMGEPPTTKANASATADDAATPRAWTNHFISPSANCPLTTSNHRSCLWNPKWINLMVVVGTPAMKWLCVCLCVCESQTVCECVWVCACACECVCVSVGIREKESLPSYNNLSDMQKKKNTQKKENERNNIHIRHSFLWEPAPMHQVKLICSHFTAQIGWLQSLCLTFLIIATEQPNQNSFQRGHEREH